MIDARAIFSKKFLPDFLTVPTLIREKDTEERERERKRERERERERGRERGEKTSEQHDSIRNVN